MSMPSLVGFEGDGRSDGRDLLQVARSDVGRSPGTPTLNPRGDFAEILLVEESIN